MKKIIQQWLIGLCGILIPAGAGSGLLTACSLDEHPKDQVEEELIYTDALSLYLNAVATLYSYIGGNTDGQGLQGTCRGVYDLQTFCTDEAMLPIRGVDWYDGGLWEQLHLHTWNSGHGVLKNAWLYLYKVITLCNRSMEKLHQYNHLLTNSQYEGLRAEMRALRAIYYWYLIDLFGPVPLVTSTETSMQQVKQSSRAEVFDFIVSELQQTLPLLSYENSVERGDYYGRVTKSVALFVLAKLMLNAEVYTGEPKWQEVIDYCNDIEELGYRLEEDYISNFIVYNEHSTENIWVIPMDKDLYTNQQQNMFRSYHYRHAAAYGFTGENGSCATLAALRIFGYGTDDEDLRFRLNFWADTVTDIEGNYVLDRSGVPLVYYPTEVRLDLSGSKYVETAGARMKKYAVDLFAPKDGKLMDNDIVLFRFADVLLMRAEAKVRLGLSGQDDFDLVRQRSFMDPRPCTLENLLDERMMELCWEGWRRQDLVRFGKFQTVTGDGAMPPGYTEDSHTSIYPIPADVIAVNQNLKQNPGY